MQKAINVWQRGTASALGGFIGIFISRQFSTNWLWTSVGLIIGLFVGWIVAMFADNPKGFVQRVKGAFAESKKVFSVSDYEQAKLRATFIFWYVVGALALMTSFLSSFVVTKTPISLIVLIIWGVTAVVVPIAVGELLMKDIPITEKEIIAIKKLAYRGNPIGLMYYIVINICRGIAWTWKHRVEIRRVINIFFANMVLYFIENAGLAILTNVALALGVGHYHGYVAGITVGFISGVTGAVIYNKGQDSLRAIVAKSN